MMQKLGPRTVGLKSTKLGHVGRVIKYLKSLVCSKYIEDRILIFITTVSTV